MRAAARGSAGERRPPRRAPANEALAGARFATPVGPMQAVVDVAGRLRGLEFCDGREARGLPLAVERSAPVIRQLAEYFAGSRRRFELPLAPQGTDFQRAVWAELLDVPFGERVSYGEIARRLGRPEAVRAVGAANGANPIAIVIPCHRVVGADGSLTGYGGGLPIKRWLLAHESGERELLGIGSSDHRIIGGWKGTSGPMNR